MSLCTQPRTCTRWNPCPVRRGCQGRRAMIDTMRADGFSSEQIAWAIERSLQPSGEDSGEKR